MKHFLEVLLLLTVALLLLASGVDVTLDHLARSPAQNTFTGYDEKGATIVAYQGNEALTHGFAGPVRIAPPYFLHRT